MSYLIPAYNEAATLPQTVELLVARLEQMPGSEIVIIENGSTDGTEVVAEQLSAEHEGGPVAVRAVRSAKGLGQALRRGIEAATGDWVVCTAADLPFRFSDLDAFLEVHEASDVVIGSKGHPRSTGDRTRLRRAMTVVFRVARLLVLGMRVRDPQGSLFVRLPLAQRLAADTVDDGFLFGTELVAFAAAAGARVREVPVDLEPLRGGSTVRPVHDSVRMLAGLFHLRRRLLTARAGRARAASAASTRPVPWIEALGERVGRRWGPPVAVAAGLLAGLLALLMAPAVVAIVSVAADQLRQRGPLAGRPRWAALAVVAAGGAAAIAVAGGWRLRRRLAPPVDRSRPPSQ